MEDQLAQGVDAVPHNGRHHGSLSTVVNAVDIVEARVGQHKIELPQALDGAKTGQMRAITF